MSYLTLNQHANNSEEIDSNLEQKLQNWSIPKIKTNQVYKIPIFEFNPDYEIKTVEKSFAVQGPYQTISILDSRIVNQHVRKYGSLHFGLVQVAVKPLTRLRCDLPILICLRDKRHLKFWNTVRAVLESDIQNGPAYFNCYPSYPVSLRDPHVTKCLDLDVKIPNEMFVDGAPPPVSIMYRFCYKVTDNLRGVKAKRSNTVNETDVIETNIAQNSSEITRILKHDRIAYPEEWLQGRSSQIPTD
ncbi:uncharacterized protein LOC130721237 [Lotus japonicus]|uniref:uncharacterized protein LOC130721237 n=1 Tax=Lotus japonicus TaxID=34305 RepID=UPI0025905CEF|nr:uncharacterized protein LOC130721237 [Lotus japonicus]